MPHLCSPGKCGSGTHARSASCCCLRDMLGVLTKGQELLLSLVNSGIRRRPLAQYEFCKMRFFRWTVPNNHTEHFCATCHYCKRERSIMPMGPSPACKARSVRRALAGEDPPVVMEVLSAPGSSGSRCRRSRWAKYRLHKVDDSPDP